MTATCERYWAAVFLRDHDQPYTHCGHTDCPEIKPKEPKP